VPALIAAAGDDAVRAYREFLADASSSTTARIRKFCRWAESRGLSLEAIDARAFVAYRTESARATSSPTAAVYLSSVRSLFRHLARSGVLPSNPCPDQITGIAEPARAGFPLLDLLAFLAHMEPESLRRIFDDEESALSLLEQARWPDGPICPHCATPTFADSPVEDACSACGRAFSVTMGTMFADSPLPVRHWFALLHRMSIECADLLDQELAERLGLSLAGLLSAAGRIHDAMVHEGLPADEDLGRTIERRNRELIEEDAVRSIIQYGELTAIRDRLHRARAEGTAVDDLPPGMTLDEAIARIEQRIAEEDRYVLTVEDGILTRHRIDSPEDLAALSRPSAGGADDMSEASDAR
jgi:hypothetical protein